MYVRDEKNADSFIVELSKGRKKRRKHRGA